MDPKKTKIAHNLKFDLQMFHNLGLEICGPYGDTMLASYVINPLAKEYNLDACALEILGLHKIATSELMGKDYSRPMADVPIEQLATYACEDADAVFQLHTHYMRALSELNLMNVYRDIEVPLAPVLARMEQSGIFINTDALFEISEKLDCRIKQLEKEIYKEAGEEFNINSPKQLQVILFEKLKIHEKLGVTRIKKTKTGFSTDVTVLEALADHPLPKAMLEFRLISKLKSTYVDTLPQLVHRKTNRIHTSFHQTGTTTGRLSSSDPNLQNIPIRTAEGREIRKAFCASSPDRVIISADYSQIELRLLAHMADDSGLKEAFMSEKDVHTATAMKVFGISADEVTPDLRSNAKAINFGIIYGMGPQRLARETNTTMVQAKDFIEKYFAGFPQIRAYIDQAKRSARDLGYSRTITGRRRPIPEIHSRERAVAVNGENMAVNSPIQGSAADLVKLAMITIQNQLEKSTLDAKLLLQVHDELVFECLETDAEKVMILVKTAMEGAMDLCVPLKVEVGKGRNWLEAH
jgi:DNA polymerase-1